LSLLDDGIKMLGLGLSDKQVGMLCSLMDEIELFNPTYRLVSYESKDELVVKHFLDSLAGVPLIREKNRNGRIADLGSGAGFPGLVIAAEVKEVEVKIIERMGRRVGFLRNAIVSMGLGNVRILDKDLSEVDECFDTVTCRAFHPVNNIIGDFERIIADGGRACLYKASRSYVQKEIEGIGGFKVEIVDLHVPFLDGNRVMCTLERV